MFKTKWVNIVVQVCGILFILQVLLIIIGILLGLYMGRGV